MEYFTQDDNYEMQHLTDDEDVIDCIESLKLPWKGDGNNVETTIEDLRISGRVRVTRHLHVTQNYTPKNRKHSPQANVGYENLIGPFFASYIEEYVERQNGKYDELVNSVRKLLKVHINGSTTKKHITVNDKGKYCLTCIDIHKNKATWRKDDYEMILRYFEFSLKPEMMESADEIVHALTISQSRNEDFAMFTGEQDTISQS